MKECESWRCEGAEWRSAVDLGVRGTLLRCARGARREARGARRGRGDTPHRDVIHELSALAVRVPGSSIFSPSFSRPPYAVSRPWLVSFVSFAFFLFSLISRFVISRSLADHGSIYRGADGRKVPDAPAEDTRARYAVISTHYHSGCKEQGATLHPLG